MPTTSPPELVARIDACLPQTQCTRCGYPRCRDYAEAIAAGAAGINRCPPGADTTLQALSDLLQTPRVPLDPSVGAPRARVRAVIDEATCIGCRKCIDACPVDAIVGARKLMHTVIARDCTGCELCLPPCPVDCIHLIPAQPRGTRWPEYDNDEVGRWRALAERHFARLAARRRSVRGVRRRSLFPDRDTIRRDIQAAIARSRARRR